MFFIHTLSIFPKFPRTFRTRHVDGPLSDNFFCGVLPPPPKRYQMLSFFAILESNKFFGFSKIIYTKKYMALRGFDYFLCISLRAALLAKSHGKRNGHTFP